MIRVALLCHNLSKETGRGIDRYSYELAKHLANKAEVRVLEQERLGKRSDWLIQDMLTLARLPRHRANVYHAVSPLLGKDAILACKRPLVSTIHDLRFIGHLGPKWLYEGLSTFLSISSDHIIVPFVFLKELILDKFSKGPNDVTVIPYAVDTGFFRPFSSRRSSRSKGFQVLYAGGINRNKGVLDLLRAFELASPDLEDATLIMAGRGPDSHACKRWVKDHGMTESVRLLGFVPEPELPGLYNSADLFVCPSRMGFSLQLLESMACGTPVLGPNTPDVREYFDGSIALVEPADPEGLAAELRKLSSDPGRLNELRNHGMQLIGNFSWERAAEMTFEVYRNLAT